MLLHRLSSAYNCVMLCRQFQSVCSAVRQACWSVRLQKYGSVSFAAGVTSTSTLLLVRLCFHVACTVGPALGSHHLSRLSDRLLCDKSWLFMNSSCVSIAHHLQKDHARCWLSELLWHMIYMSIEVLSMTELYVLAHADHCKVPLRKSLQGAAATTR